MNQQSVTDDEQCWSYGDALEDDVHLFQCKARPQFLQQLTNELIKYDQELDLKLLNLLLDGIYNYVNGEIPPLIHTCQVMEQLGPTQNTNNINPYITEYKKIYGKYHLLLAEQDSIGWDNLLCGKLSKQWRISQTFNEDQRKLANCVAQFTTNDVAPDLTTCRASVSTTNVPGDASPKTKKKRKANVFQRIISTIFNSAETMWNHRNKDRHCRENDTAISEIVKVDITIKLLYGMRDLVLPDDIDTYFDVDLDTRLNNSLRSKQIWITWWQKSIYASIKKAKQNASLNTGKIWKFCDQDRAPHFLVRLQQDLKSACNQKRTKNKKVLRLQKLTSTQGFQIQPVKQSMSTVPPALMPKK